VLAEIYRRRDESGGPVVRAHPDAAPAVEAALEAERARRPFAFPRGVRVEPDAAVRRDRWIVRSDRQSGP
jgi:hypothetical protein